MRAKSFSSVSPSSLLVTVRTPNGKVAVGSNGSTTGGNVFGGKVGSVPRAREFTWVSAPFGSTSSRKYRRTTLTPRVDLDSTNWQPVAWLVQRSMRLVMVFSTELVGMPA